MPIVSVQISPSRIDERFEKPHSTSLSFRGELICHKQALSLSLDAFVLFITIRCNVSTILKDLENRNDFNRDEKSAKSKESSGVKSREPCVSIVGSCYPSCDG
jgi:hypothetical protein